MALDFAILRIVIGMDGVDHPGAQTLDDGLAIIFRAQRRAELEIGPVAADVVFIQAEIVDRDAGRNPRARRVFRGHLVIDGPVLGFADELDAALG
ncbi:hypothetical protein D3C71_1925030 [compost metagenome]